MYHVYSVSRENIMERSVVIHRSFVYFVGVRRKRRPRRITG
jgi:hypothetical protein